MAPGHAGDVEVVKSPNDKKLYRFVVLENGLKVLLISDPQMGTADPAAAASTAEAKERPKVRWHRWAGSAAAN